MSLCAKMWHWFDVYSQITSLYAVRRSEYRRRRSISRLPVGGITLLSVNYLGCYFYNYCIASGIRNVSSNLHIVNNPSKKWIVVYLWIFVNIIHICLNVFSLCVVFLHFWVHLYITQILRFYYYLKGLRF